MPNWASPITLQIHSSSLSTSAPTILQPLGALTIDLSSLPMRLRFAFDAVSHVFSIARRVTVPIVITCGRIRPRRSSCGAKPMRVSASPSHTTTCRSIRSRALIQ